MRAQCERTRSRFTSNSVAHALDLLSKRLLALIFSCGLLHYVIESITVAKFPLEHILSIRNVTMTLDEAFTQPDVVIYFLHQRKAGGTTLRRLLFEKYVSVAGQKVAQNNSYIPCVTCDCDKYDIDVRKHFSGSLKLVAGHISYHVPAARALFHERQVLITNFREPFSRLQSCIAFRHPVESVKVFNSTSFNMNEAVLLLSKVDKYGDSCSGESFRILSPFDPDAAADHDMIARVCHIVVTSFHVLFVDDDNATPLKESRIESEIRLQFSKLILNRNVKQKTELYTSNMQAFIKHVSETSDTFKSEIQLYDCVRNHFTKKEPSKTVGATILSRYGRST